MPYHHKPKYQSPNRRVWMKKNKDVVCVLLDAVFIVSNGVATLGSVMFYKGSLLGAGISKGSRLFSSKKKKKKNFKGRVKAIYGGCDEATN